MNHKEWLKNEYPNSLKAESILLDKEIVEPILASEELKQVINCDPDDYDPDLEQYGYDTYPIQ